MADDLLGAPFGAESGSSEPVAKTRSSRPVMWRSGLRTRASSRGETPQIGAHIRDYAARLSSLLNEQIWDHVEALADDLLECWQAGRQVFIAGNGGSAGNAIHLANDLLYALSKRRGSGLRVHALPANGAVMTALANDEGYENVFAMQLAVQARPGDILIVLSGSGNSPNVLAALKEASHMNLYSYAIVGFDGGMAQHLANSTIHTAIDDMQIAEDMQLIIGHMVVQWLYSQRDSVRRIL